jgi:hypothetical protein
VPRFEGADRVEIDALGDLVLHTAAGSIRQKKPVVYQVLDGARREIERGYVLGRRQRVSFAIGAYDPTRPLIIDPVVLSYATFIGGSGTDYGVGIAADADGSVYTAGIAASIDFPTTGGAVFSASGLAPDGIHTLAITVLGAGRSLLGGAIDAPHVAVDVST